MTGVTTMGPPPASGISSMDQSSDSAATDLVVLSRNDASHAADTSNSGVTSMGPPPDRTTTDLSVSEENRIPSVAELSSTPNADCSTIDFAAQPVVGKRPNVPYVIPEWSGPPCHKYHLEVIKDGAIIDKLEVSEKGAYMFGRVDLCDFVLEHPTISRFHAVLQFKRSGDAYVFDTGSTHGTFINKKLMEKRIHVELHVGDILRFGKSSRLYIFHGPTNLMPLETDHKMLKKAKIQQHLMDREASVRRAKIEASLADGISWGMEEDAIEELEEDGEELTWQTYKGNLTEKQEKTREKILKRTEKIAHMKKEIDAIRAKDIAQGGLTQGQQTQIARNEIRMTQILEELENLEETLNDSIRESLGARSGAHEGKNKVTVEDNKYFSDDDDFYDRTKKPIKVKANESETVTADSLIDKRDIIMEEMEEKKRLLTLESNKMESENTASSSSRDSLDDFMTGVSSMLVMDKTLRIEKEISSLQVELDRVLFLLKIADPSGEASKLRILKSQFKPEMNRPDTDLKEIKNSEVEKKLVPENIVVAEKKDLSTPSDATVSEKQEAKSVVTAYNPVKPQWLGAKNKEETEEEKPEDLAKAENLDHFVDYKDRQKILLKVEEETVEESEIERAAPGLIIRKRKEKEKSSSSDENLTDQRDSSAMADLIVEDAVALLLKHKGGYYGYTDEDQVDDEDMAEEQEESRSDNKRTKRYIGPEKPNFLKSKLEYESWLPPEGQSGDGRTSLNERFGY